MPRLRDKAIAPLTATATGRGLLQHLDLTGCSGLTSKSLAVLGQLTSLHSLVCTGERWVQGSELLEAAAMWVRCASNLVAVLQAAGPRHTRPASNR